MSNETVFHGHVAFLKDAVLNGGKSMSRGESLQRQIEQAPLRAFHIPTITGWKDAAGKSYATSMAQQLAFNAQGIADMRAELGAIKELLQQIATSANNGVAVNIDYDRIKSMMPTYELTPVAEGK